MTVVSSIYWLWLDSITQNKSNKYFMIYQIFHVDSIIGPNSVSQTN